MLISNESLDGFKEHTVAKELLEKTERGFVAMLTKHAAVLAEKLNDSDMDVRKRAAHALTELDPETFERYAAAPLAAIVTASNRMLEEKVMALGALGVLGPEALAADPSLLKNTGTLLLSNLMV